jgi:hypothetical protein
MTRAKASLTFTKPPLSGEEIAALHARIDEFIDQLVAEEKEKTPNQPKEVLRALLMRGQCACTAATRLLKEREHG